MTSIVKQIIRNEDIKIADDLMKEAQGKRVVIDKATGKAKEVDIYDRPEPVKKKVDNDKQRAMLSSNLEQVIIPEGTSKYYTDFPHII